MRTRIDYEYLQHRLRQLFIREGVIPAVWIMQQLGITQPTLSRLMNKMKPAILITGQARLARYALKRSIPGVGESFPIYEIDPEGTTVSLLTIHAVEPHGYIAEAIHADLKTRFYEDIPYFLDDLRPAGFLGRLIPKQHSDLNLPQDIRSWHAEHCLLYLCRESWNSVGSYIIGEESLQKYITSAPGAKIFQDSIIGRYETISEDIARFGEPGSSAGGEQPKFLDRHPDRGHVLVKFSPPVRDQLGARRADLLICEHIAHETCVDYGIPAAESSILRGTDRVFLEIKRFDRTEQGRRGLISLAALDAEFTGTLGCWGEIASALAGMDIIENSVYQRICWLDLFGRLIGNSDMHNWNLSFYTFRTHILGLAPVYDMTPMIYSPQHDQIPDRPFVPPAPGIQDGLVWKSAWPAALDFWQRVETHDGISDNFKRLASKHRHVISGLEPAFKRLPISNPLPFTATADP